MYLLFSNFTIVPIKICKMFWLNFCLELKLKRLLHSSTFHKLIASITSIQASRESSLSYRIFLKVNNCLCLTMSNNKREILQLSVKCCVHVEIQFNFSEFLQFEFGWTENISFVDWKCIIPHNNKDIINGWIDV